LFGILREVPGATYRWRNSLRTTLEKLCRITEPEQTVEIVRDPKDDPVLAAAMAANCPYLVTGDHDLLALGTYDGVKIVTASQFLALPPIAKLRV